MNQAEIVDTIGKMTIMEVTELVTLLEETFNVSGDIQVSAAPVVVEEVEEATEFDLWLETYGEKKVAIIKIIRAATGLGLKESKELAESAPGARVLASVDKGRAEELQKEIKEAGGEASIKPAVE